MLHRSFLTILFLSPSLASAADDGLVAPLKRSDVVFMGGGSKESYQAYGATVVDWGGHAWNDTEKAVSDFRARVKMAQDLGISYNAGIGMLTEFLGMIKSEPQHERAIARGIDGKPLTVPWLWDHKVDGELGKAWWFCSNSPLYQNYLHKLAARAVAGQPEGFHIDDFGGTAGSMWIGGCFCESCTKGFREYLKQNVPRETLSALGITNLDSFDYGQFLRTTGGVKDAEDYKKRRSKLPLDAEFREFQALAAGKVVKDVQEHAAKLRGKPMPRSVNGAPPNQQALVVRPHVDHYSCEVWMGAAKKRLQGNAAFVYKCGDMARRAIAGTADGDSWAYISETGAKNLCRYWIAESYALGQCFMAPSERQWCYTREKGTHWLKNKSEDYADLYKFVRKNAELFDGYEAAAQVGVIFSHPAWRKNKKDVEGAASALLWANIPFAMVAAGDALLDLRLDAASLARFEKIIVPAEPMLDPVQQKVLDGIAADRKIVLKDPKALPNLIKSWITVEGASAQGEVWALPRYKTIDAKNKSKSATSEAAPLVIHVLNRNYDASGDKMVPQQNVIIKLSGGKKLSRCMAISPGAAPLPLSIQPDGSSVRITLPKLELWTVLKVE